MVKNRKSLLFVGLAALITGAQLFAGGKVAIGLIAKNASGQDMVLLANPASGQFNVFGTQAQSGEQLYDAALRSLAYCTGGVYTKDNVEQVTVKPIGSNAIFIVEGKPSDTNPALIENITPSANIGHVTWVPADKLGNYPIAAKRSEKFLRKVLNERQQARAQQQSRSTTTTTETGPSRSAEATRTEEIPTSSTGEGAAEEGPSRSEEQTNQVTISLVTKTPSGDLAVLLANPEPGKYTVIGTTAASGEERYDAALRALAAATGGKYNSENVMLEQPIGRLFIAVGPYITAEEMSGVVWVSSEEYLNDSAKYTAVEPTSSWLLLGTLLYENVQERIARRTEELKVARQRIVAAEQAVAAARQRIGTESEEKEAAKQRIEESVAALQRMGDAAEQAAAAERRRKETEGEEREAARQRTVDALQRIEAESKAIMASLGRFGVSTEAGPSYSTEDEEVSAAGIESLQNKAPGTRVAQRFVDMASFSAANSFAIGEVVIVPRSGGYYTTGMIIEDKGRSRLMGTLTFSGKYDVQVGEKCEGGTPAKEMLAQAIGKLPS